ncbi:lysophospholipase L1-like esterase [Breznakibacter xylanolyticus]|uniref:Lysophospholipase L1-like esterase n=1 Tax=Breznakibacter xylanolyticus TaxID=990 RepID=A0A2W7QA72_9BACT|nr:rhamnogalacturonan acetylesterase [Breznakibacter xylanolyticus]PZX18639.1 lysophospholipase L1-like esterase [Breznakibacter xylanolyticus]
MKKLLFICAAFVLFVTSVMGQAMKFDFGNGKTAKGYTRVAPEMVYSDASGFGFDYNTRPAAEKHKKGNALTSDYCFSDRPFYFSVKLPEGNYDVTLTLGNPNGTSSTTVKAESRRLMLEKMQTVRGETLQRTFTVNVRTPRISDNERIRIKPREKGYLNWDNKLTIEFGDSLPSVCAMEIVPNATATTVFLAGNSTVVDQDKEPWAAWGQMITRFFEHGKVVVANYAESGEALHSFKASQRLAKILSVMKPGDYLFIEFGHNDQKRKGDEHGAWGSYSDLMREFVSLTRQKGGNPVIVTSMHRRNFDANGKVVHSLGDFPAAARKVAADMQVPLVDLNQMSEIMYEAWGPEKSIKAFVHYPANTWPGQEQKLEDNTHFNSFGAYEIARCIRKGIIDLKLPLAQFLTTDVPEFDPSHPDDPDSWSLSISPMAANEKPDGN